MLTAFRRAADVVHRLFNGKEQAHPLSLEAYQEDLVELLKNVLQERGTVPAAPVPTTTVAPTPAPPTTCATAAPTTVAPTWAS